MTRRTLGAALGWGSANAAVAVVVLYLMSHRQSRGLGWFAYAPLTDARPVQFANQFDWTFVVLPVALLLLNVVGVLVAARRTRRR